MIVIEIGEGTFGSNHNLIEVIFGNNIKKIGPYAFYGCNNLKGDLIISDKIKEIPYLAFERCGFNGTLKIPSSVSTIQEHNFKNANFQEIIIYNTEDNIPRNLFSITAKIEYKEESIAGK